MPDKTTRLGLNKPTTSPPESAWGPPLNDNLDTLDAMAPLTGLLVALAEDPSTTLRVKVWGGSFRSSAGARVDYAGAVVTLPGSATGRKLWLEDDGTLDHDTAYPGTAHLPLASVDTDADSVTAIVDDRLAFAALGSVSASTQSANTIYAGPTSGGAAVPTFRAMVAADVAAHTQAASTITDFAEAVDDRVNALLVEGTNITLTYDDGAGTLTIDAPAGSGTVTSVDLTMPSDLFTVSGNPVTTAGGFSVAKANQAANTVFAGPTSGGAAQPAMRALVTADLPASSVTPGSYTSTNLTVDQWGRITAAANGSAGTGAPSSAKYIVQSSDAGLSNEQALDALATGLLKNTTGTGVLSIAAAGTDYLAPSGNGSALTGIAQAQISGLTTGSSPTFAGLTVGTLSGVLKASSGVLAAAVAGTDYLATNGNGSALTALNASALASGTVNTARLGSGTADSTTYLRGDGTWNTPAGTGTVTSVALSLPSIITVSGSPVTTSGTLTGSLATQTANTVWAGPSSGSAAAPTFRAQVADDIPALPASKITSGTVDTARLGSGTASSSTYLRGDQTWQTISGGSGTVTSVGLTAPSALFTTVSGTPVTSSGTIGLALAGQSNNYVFAGPTSGGPLTPVFRLLAASDIPSLAASKITSGTIDTARLGSGTASSSTFLRGDQTWATPDSAPGSIQTKTGASGTPPATQTFTASQMGLVKINAAAASGFIVGPTGTVPTGTRMTFLRTHSGANRCAINISVRGGSGGIELTAQWAYVTLQYDGSGWNVVGESASGVTLNTPLTGSPWE